MLESLDIAPLEWDKLLTAMVCGFLIGFERQYHGKPAGIRTSILVCMGAYVFVRVGWSYQEAMGGVRVLGQLVTGIGFLGAGMMLSKEGIVHGVTSAAIVWILAAIGSLIGFGNTGAAIAISVAVLTVLLGIHQLERVFKFLSKGIYKRFKEDQKMDE